MTFALTHFSSTNLNFKPGSRLLIGYQHQTSEIGERLACPVCPPTSTMPGDQFPQGWEEMMQPINFDEFDFDYSWMADDSP